MRSSLRSLAKESLKLGQTFIRGQLINIPIAEITDEFAFSLAPDGWNYYKAIVQDYAVNPQANLQNTIYYQFFKHPQINQVCSLDELLMLNHNLFNDSDPFYLGTYPWGGLTVQDSAVGGTPFGWFYDQVTGSNTKNLWGCHKTLWYQPDSQNTIEFEWRLTTALYLSLKKGYRPLRNLSIPKVCLLLRQNGDRKGIIVDGHHRLGILACLNYQEVRVEVTQVVKEQEVANWYYVKQGQCSRDRALAIFNSFFTLTGQERLKCLQVT